jgi:hypothetical protein
MKANVGTGEVCSLSEDGVPDLGDGQGLVAADDLGKPGEISSRGECEGFTGDRDRRDIVASQRGVRARFSSPRPRGPRYSVE